MTRAEAEVRLPASALTTSTNIGGWHVMAAHQDTKTRQCSKCSIVKPLDDFQSHWDYPDGKRPFCKECGGRRKRELRSLRSVRVRTEKNPLLPGTITPDTKILDDEGRDWAWAFAIFRPVDGHEEYRVGSDGSFWVRRGAAAEFGHPWRRLNPTKQSNGYILARCGRGYWALLNWLVLETFIGPRPPKADACHNDGDRSNNKLRNLRWDSRKGNFADMAEHGTRPWGSNNAHAKLREADIPVIRKLKREGLSAVEIGLMYGVSDSAIRDIVNRRRWRHVD